jgi:hypothetical protein
LITGRAPELRILESLANVGCPDVIAIGDPADRPDANTEAFVRSSMGQYATGDAEPDNRVTARNIAEFRGLRCPRRRRIPETWIGTYTSASFSVQR